MMRTQPEIFDDLVLAEAAAWLARLQGEQRTDAAVAAFKIWLADDVSHARAFARVTETWDIVPGAARLLAKPATQRVRRSRHSFWMMAAASVVCLLMASAGAWYFWKDPTYRTAIGEQRTITLQDGSNITLNTDTELTVSYRQAERRIHLVHGEAVFEVAKNAQRPFIVLAGNEQVRALGTLFDVRSDPSRLAVFLVKGSVEVSSRQGASSSDPQAQAMILSPGQRVTLGTHGGKLVDRPDLAAAMAWRQGQVMFDNVALSEAIAELDRYGGTRIELGDPALASLRVSGVFNIRNPSEFSSTIAQLHGLKVVQSYDKMIIER